MLRRLLAILPLILFISLAFVFFIQLEKDEAPNIIPSVLIGKQAPKIDLPALPGLGRQMSGPFIFEGQVSIVNIWASWCAPCRIEHPFLMRLAENPRVQIIGINYKDREAHALRFLEGLGNPYDHVGVDTNGRAGIEWGVYGVPETFIVDHEGLIRYKFVGPLTEARFRDAFLPELEKALEAAGLS